MFIKVSQSLNASLCLTVKQFGTRDKLLVVIICVIVEDVTLAFQLYILLII